jgi:hypothetical protein
MNCFAILRLSSFWGRANQRIASGVGAGVRNTRSYCFPIASQEQWRTIDRDRTGDIQLGNVVINRKQRTWRSPDLVLAIENTGISESAILQ